MKVLIVLSALVLFFNFALKAEIPTNLTEKFDPSLARLNDLNKLEAYLDSLVKVKGIERTSKEEVMLINSILEDRFYHVKTSSEYATYSPFENLIAYLLGNFIRYDLGAIVIPNDVLKYSKAACSQQSIVMMSLLMKRGYKVRKLILKAHFVHEVYFDNHWHLFDPHKETLYQGIRHEDLLKYFNNGANTVVYVPGMTIEETQKMFSQMEIGKVNRFPAVKARWFHRITKVLSVVLALVLFLLPFHFYEKRNERRRKKIKEIKPASLYDRVLMA